MIKKVLVTGGCGFIGSHSVVDLLENGYEVVSLDNLSNSDETPLDGIEQITGKRVQNYAVDLRDMAALERVFAAHNFMGVVHFAAHKAVGESVKNPIEFYQNNVAGMFNLVQCVQKYGIQHFIFSSSCSVYGNSTELPVTENTPIGEPQSPYAHTKQIGEKILENLANIEPNFKVVNLRYFNPAGAHESAKMGEDSINLALNLVPVITETAIGLRKETAVFGNDYPTRDGSCIRDYIHVMDIAHAHTLALQQIESGNNKSKVGVYNLGIGDGVSVLEAIYAFEKVSGQKLNYRIVERRAGDVVSIYCNYEKAKAELGWTPKYNIEDIMRTAWAWENVRRRVFETM